MREARFFYLRQKERSLFVEQKGHLLELSSLLQVHFEDEEDFLTWSLEHLPYVTSTRYSSSEETSLVIVIHARRSQRVEAFLIDLIQTRLFSDTIQLRSLDYTPFVLEADKEEHFLIADFQFSVERKGDGEKIWEAAIQIRKELALYMSAFPYSKILLKQGALLAKDESHLYQAVLKLSHRWPDHIGRDFLQDYHHFLGIAPKEFKEHRSLRHQLSLLASLYLMRKKVMRKLPLSPNELYLEMRLVPNRLYFPFGQKEVLGIAIVIHLRSSYERFNSHHISMAIERLIFSTQLIQESFLLFQKPGSSLQSIYLEVEKKGGSPFTPIEIRTLKRSLRQELVKSVEVLSPSIFGLCDLEETIRNTFLLGQELETPDDLPQVMISFEGASAKSLIFRIILVRLLGEETKPLPFYFQRLTSPFEYVPERSSTIAYTGKYKKEASIFRLQIAKEVFLFRSDSSLNLYHARQYVYSLLKEALGEIRDYNGGIFAKQLELFSQFKELFEGEEGELLEDFFHSIHPPEMQATLSLSDLTLFFQIFLLIRKRELSREDGYILETKVENSSLFAFVRIRDDSLQERIRQMLVQKGLFHEITAYMAIKGANEWILGYIYHNSSENYAPFSEVVHRVLEEWKGEKQSSQILRLEMQDVPVSLDPRIGGDELSGALLKLLFEGLMRIGEDGKPHFAIAKSLSISEERTRYTFFLRNALWNNGDPVTSYDFSYAWKTLLSPHFSTVFAYLFYEIKNAKKFKEGEVSIEEVGIYPIDDLTLVVELERPCTYFLELICNPIYSPVNHRVDRLHPNWPLQTGKAYICNGPFQLEYGNSRDAYLLEKNQAYWDATAVKLDRIHIAQASARRALEQFEKGEIDWLGRPSRPWESFFSSIRSQIKELPSSAMCWCTPNVTDRFLQSQKLRLALTYSIDRKEIVGQLPNNCLAAFSPLPYRHAKCQRLFTGKEREQAKELFEEALKELGIRKEEFPSLTLIHPNNGVREKIAEIIVRQWKEVLGITVYPEGHPFSDLFTKITQGKYQLGLIMWRPWVDDPLYTLSALANSREGINFSNWEDARYQELLGRYHEEVDIAAREQLLLGAESILIEKTPIIPICYESEFYARNENIEGVYFSRVGNIDFKCASIKKK